MAGSVMSESKTSRSVFSVGFRPSYEPTFGWTHDRRNHRVQGDRGAAHLTKTATSRGPSKASRPLAAKNAGSNYTGNKGELGKKGKQPTSGSWYRP
jgi:hypothetical protein